MNKHVSSLALVAMWQVLAACASTQPVAKVDEVKQKLEIYSSADSRTTMPSLKGNEKVAKSTSDLRAKLKSDPRDLKSLLNLAQLNLLQERLDAAEDACKQALRVDLKNREARKTLAQVYFRKGNYDMAAIILNNLGGEDSKDSQILNIMALVALKQDRKADAHALFKKALTVNANDLAVRMNLGVLYLQYRQLAEASVQFERVLKVMPGHNDAKIHLAVIKATRGQHQAAQEIYAKILSDKKDNPLALYNMAVLENRMKNYDQAVDLLKRYLATDYAKQADNTEAFALIDEVRSKKDAASAETSDDEIQEMAAKMKSTPGGSQAAAASSETAAPAVPAKPQNGDADIDSLESELK